MIDFKQTSEVVPQKYWCIVYKLSGDIVHLPFKREWEKQTYILLPFNEKNLDSSSYWVEGVANKLLRKLCKDQLLNWDNYAIYEWDDNTFK